MLDELTAAGACALNMVGAAGAARPDAPGRRAVRHRDRPPAGARGGIAAVAGRTPGVTIRRGVAVTGLLDRGSAVAGVPRVAGRADRRAASRARRPGGGLRRPALAARRRGWRRRRPAAGRGAGGLGLRLLRPALPVRRPASCRRQTGHLLQHYDSVSLADPAGRQRHLERGLHHQQPGPGAAGLRDPARCDAALARYPLAAHWG